MAVEAFEFPAQRRGLPWGGAASGALHAGFLAVAILAFPHQHLEVAPPPPVAVEILTPAEFARLDASPALVTRQAVSPTFHGRVAPAPTAPAADEDRLPQTTPAGEPMPSRETYRATSFYAAGILREAGMARIRETFNSLAGSERLVQLCNIEGLEQIRRAQPQFDPDTLVSYAMADTQISGLTLTAPGGAFRSRRRWYGISFSCSVGADLASVTAFAFRIGGPIPRSEWEDHDLNAEDADE